jgi:hypothetical protein
VASPRSVSGLRLKPILRLLPPAARKTNDLIDTSEKCCRRRARQVTVDSQDASYRSHLLPSNQAAVDRGDGIHQVVRFVEDDHTVLQVDPQRLPRRPAKTARFLGDFRSETWGFCLVCLFNDLTVRYGYRATSLSTRDKRQRFDPIQSWAGTSQDLLKMGVSFLDSQYTFFGSPMSMMLVPSDPSNKQGS